MMIVTMTTRENEFEPKIGKSRSEPAPRRLAQVRTAVCQVSRIGATRGPKAGQPSIRAHFAKGSQTRARAMSAMSRRVVVKVRYTSNLGGKTAPLKAHVAYLARVVRGRSQAPDSVQDEKAQTLDLTHDPTHAVDYLGREAGDGTGRFQFYDRASSGMDAKAVTQAWADDPRHFRMIVSPEDGEALGDLKPFIREVMDGLERRLGTKVEWLAVNHHDTDNPHSHVLIRGRRADGQELFIPSRLIASGIREHAQEIATRVLGPRLAVDLEKERFRDISLKGPTLLDRELLAAACAGPILPTRADLVARLQRLEGWDLAARETDGWRLAPDLAGRLREMAEHEDVARTIAPLLTGREPQLLLAADRSAAITGELLHLRPTDEFADRFVAIIETGAGELRYARFDRAQDLAILADVRPGAIVTFEPNEPQLHPSDHAVARIAAVNGGVYSAEAHAALEPHTDRRIIDANIRRLEAMRRLGLLERSADGRFGVSDDHLATATAFEERQVRRAPFSVQMASYWSLGEQIDAYGPTHIDRVLAGEAEGPAGGGRVAREFERSLQQRRLFLIEQGWMGPADQAPSRQALQRMAMSELSTQAKALTDELGMPVLTYSAHRVSGVYARRIDLAQGRVALIIGERQAHLVPWRPPLERLAGREVEGVMRGQGMSWSLQRGIGIGLGIA